MTWTPTSPRQQGVWSLTRFPAAPGVSWEFSRDLNFPQVFLGAFPLQLATSPQHLPQTVSWSAPVFSRHSTHTTGIIWLSKEVCCEEVRSRSAHRSRWTFYFCSPLKINWHLVSSVCPSRSDKSASVRKKTNVPDCGRWSRPKLMLRISWPPWRAFWSCWFPILIHTI